MKRNYNIKKLNPRPNPYAEKLQRKQVTIDMDISTASYFETKANVAGIPMQTLIQSYLDECAEAKSLG